MSQLSPYAFLFSSLDDPTFVLTRFASLSFFFPTLLLSLVIASNYEPYSIIEKLTKYLAGSANIVVYSPYLQVRALIPPDPNRVASLLKLTSFPLHFLTRSSPPLTPPCELILSTSTLPSLSPGCGSGKFSLDELIRS